VWIGLAALTNALGGTVRQIAWLGVLVMVPSTLWLLRRKKTVLLCGGVLNLAGMGIVLLALRWFSHQPYALSEPLLPEVIDARAAENVVNTAVRAGAELVLLLLPLLCAFFAPLRHLNRRMAAIFAAVCLPFLLFGSVELRHHALKYWLAPFWGDFVTARGVVNVHPIIGQRPIVLPEGVCLLLTIATIAALAAFLAVLFGRTVRGLVPPSEAACISWQALGVLLLPFCLANIALFTPRASSGDFKDRYLLPLMVASILALARYCQERLQPSLPVVGVVVLLVFGAFSVAATHDLFAMYRGILTATREVRAGGVPETAIGGSWEHDGWTQLQVAGYVNDRRIRVPHGAYVPQPPSGRSPACAGDLFDPANLPAMRPRYGLSFDPAQCVWQGEFPAVTYRTWLAPQRNTIYIVKYPQ